MHPFFPPKWSPTWTPSTPPWSPRRRLPPGPGRRRNGRRPRRGATSSSRGSAGSGSRPGRMPIGRSRGARWWHWVSQALGFQATRLRERALTLLRFVGMFLEILAEELLAARMGVPPLPLSLSHPSTATFRTATTSHPTAPPGSVDRPSAATASKLPLGPALSDATESHPLTTSRRALSNIDGHTGDLNDSDDDPGILPDLPDSSFPLGHRASFLVTATPSRFPTSEPNSEASSVGPASSDSDETSTEGEEGEDEDDEAEAEERLPSPSSPAPVAARASSQLATPRKAGPFAASMATLLRSAMKHSRNESGLTGDGAGGLGEVDGRGRRPLEGRSVSFSSLK